LLRKLTLTERKWPDNPLGVAHRTAI